MLILLSPSTYSLRAALTPQVIMQNIDSEKCKLVYGGERLTLFVSLEQQYQKLYNRYLHFSNISSNICTEKNLGLQVYLNLFLHGSICSLRLIAITSSDLTLEPFSEVLLINESINDF